MNFKSWLENRKAILPIKTPSEDIHDVLASNYNYGKIVGNKTLPVNQIKTIINANDPNDKERIDNLVQQMSSPSGYISRIIVDNENNVIEGRHRLESFKKLGFETIPVVVVKDLEKEYNITEVFSKLKETTKLHKDQIRSLILEAINALEQSNNSEDAIQNFKMPSWIQPAFENTLRLLKKI